MSNVYQEQVGEQIKLKVYRVLIPTFIPASIPTITDPENYNRNLLTINSNDFFTNDIVKYQMIVFQYNTLFDIRYLYFTYNFNEDKYDVYGYKLVPYISEIILNYNKLNLKNVRIGRINNDSHEFVEHDSSSLNNLTTIIEYTDTPPSNITSRPYYKGFVIKDKNVGIVSHEDGIVKCVETEPLHSSFIENGSNAIPVKQDSTGDVYVDLNCDFVKCNTLRIGNFILTTNTNGEIQITDSRGARLMGNVDFLGGNIDYSIINNSEIF